MSLLQDAQLDRLYMQDLFALNPLLEAMSQRGMPLLPERRQVVARELAHNRQLVWAAMQLMVPLGARREKIYKRLPKTPLPGLYERPCQEAIWVCEACQQPRVTKTHPCLKRGSTRTRIQQAGSCWVLPLPFTPSNDQMKRYCKLKGYTLPVRDGRATADEAAVRRLALRHETDPLFPLVLAFREVDRLVSAYLGTA